MSDAGAICSGCGRSFNATGTQLDLTPRLERFRPVVPLGSRYQGRRGSLTGIRRRIVDAVYPNTVRFVGDAQRSHGPNAHRRLLDFMAPPQLVTLDLGSGHRRLYPHVITADIAADATLDFRLDAHVLPFCDGTFDRIIVQELLEHVVEPTIVIAEALRALKPNGQLYVEVPFLYPIHDRTDYRRWTMAGLVADVRGAELTESGVSVGPFSAMTMAVRAAFTAWISNAYVAALVDIAVGWLVWPLKFLDASASAQPDTQIAAGAIYAIFRKP